MFYKKSFLKIEPLAQLFSYEFSEIFKNTFITEHLWTTASVKITNINSLNYLI